MRDWYTAQKRQIRRLDDAALTKELAFAKGFAPPTTTLEHSWLEELRAETLQRQKGAATA